MPERHPGVVRRAGGEEAPGPLAVPEAPLLLLEEPEGDHDVGEHLGSARVGADSRGDLSGVGAVADGGEEVELEGREEGARRLPGAQQRVELLGEEAGPGPAEKDHPDLRPVGGRLGAERRRVGVPVGRERLAAGDVLLDDLRRALGRDLRVPPPVGLDGDVRPPVADADAAAGGHEDPAVEPGRRALRLDLLQERLAAGGGAARDPGPLLLRADEDVLFEDLLDHGAALLPTAGEYPDPGGKPGRFARGLRRYDVEGPGARRRRAPRKAIEQENHDGRPSSSPYRLGRIELRNRIVMAPMTRCRCPGNTPGEIVATYYRQRAGAGLIVTEGTSPSPGGLGYPRIPGIFRADQIEGWRKVADAVHDAGGRIFLQLMQTGRVGHPDNLPAGAELLAPSAVAAVGEIWTDTKGMQPHPAPRAMTSAEVSTAVDDFAKAAANAVEAGLDGVEIHGANGYLVDQFLNPGSNRRDDEWGGDAARRNRFAVEVARACSASIGGDRVGIRLSPYGVFNDLAPFDGLEEQYASLAKELAAVGIVYVHLVDHSPMGAPKPAESTVTAIREAFGGPLVVSGGYDRARAEADLASGRGHLVAFGRPFLSNPDLVERLRSGAPLAAPDPASFYTPGPAGYTDYPALSKVEATA